MELSNNKRLIIFVLLAVLLPFSNADSYHGNVNVENELTFGQIDVVSLVHSVEITSNSFFANSLITRNANFQNVEVNTITNSVDGIIHVLRIT